MGPRVITSVEVAVGWVERFMLNVTHVKAEGGCILGLFSSFYQRLEWLPPPPEAIVTTNLPRKVSPVDLGVSNRY